MSHAPDDPPPRRPFEHLRERETESFYRSPEFQRILWFGSLLAVLALFAWFALVNAPRGSEPAKASVATEAVAPAPTPAELEQRKLGLLTLYEGALNDTANGQDFAETEGYRRLLQILASYTPEQFSARVAREFDYSEAMRDPGAWRGEIVRVRGIVAGLTAVRLDRPVFGLRDVYRGALTDTLTDEEEGAGVIFDFVETPPEFEMRRDVVDVEGIFYRTVRYETQYETRAGKFREEPYLLVRNFRVVPDVPTHATGFLRDHAVAVLVGMAVVFGLTRLLMYLFQRRARMRRPARSTAARTDFNALFEKHLRSNDQGAGPRPPV